MKALLQLNNKAHKDDTLEFIDELPFLKICGKTIIGYYFDFLYQLGVEEVFICSNKLKIQERLLFIDTFNIKIHFLQSPDSRSSYATLYEQVKEEELVIIDGFGFIQNDLNIISASFFDMPENGIFVHNTFKILYIKKHFTDISFENFKVNFNLSLKEIDTISDYFIVSDYIVKDLNHQYTLPGYSNEEGIIIGKNVEIDKKCKLVAPVIIMDNVKICENSQIGPNTVINENVFIEHDCEITNTIVYDNTYLNTNLKLDYKFILSNIIVDRTNVKVYNIDKKFAFTNTYGLLKF